MRARLDRISLNEPTQQTEQDSLSDLDFDEQAELTTEEDA